jgi:isopentenyl diphosphate isomerase/L-lactate dehydrogenase-like FMN-dependent dehydrogenase
MLNSATKPGWLTRLAIGRKITYGNYLIEGRSMRMSEMDSFMHKNDNPGATWADVAELRDRWPGKIVVKGVMTAEDTRAAVQHGVDAVFVSNHGGRQFDAQPSTIASLPEVVAAADGKLEVIMDSGIRRGSDVAKSLALGATACSIGRSAAFGLAAVGPAGVDQVFDILREELLTVLGFVGVADVKELCKSVIFER